MSTAKKADLLELAGSCIRIVKASKPGSAGHLFRLPANKTTPAERTRVVMPNPPSSDQWVSGGADVLRLLMPVVELSVILEWLVFRCSRLDPPGPVISRGLQRAMDVGLLRD